jgi:hypothetical protein
MSNNVNPSNVLSVQVVVGGDHGNTAFQFGASVSVKLCDGYIIEFNVSACKLICRKDTAKLIQQYCQVLPLDSWSWQHIPSTYKDEHGNILCEFSSQTCRTTEHAVETIPNVEVHVTGDLAFLAMVFGKESMSGHWCMLCTMQMQCTLTQDQLNAVKRWTMEEYCMLGDEAEKQKGEPKLGVKKKPWWPFIPVSHFMVPLLHL